MPSPASEMFDRLAEHLPAGDALRLASYAPTSPTPSAASTIALAAARASIEVPDILAALPHAGCLALLLEAPHHAAALFESIDDATLPTVVRQMAERNDAVPASVWSAFVRADRPHYDVEVAIGMGNASGTDAELRELETLCFEQIFDRSQTEPTQLCSMVTPARALTHSKNEALRDAAFPRFLSNPAVPAHDLALLCDHLVEIIPTLTDAMTVSALEEAIEQLCEVHTYLMVGQRPRLAAAFVDLAEAPDTARDVSIASRRAVRFALPEKVTSRDKALTLSFSEILEGAQGDNVDALIRVCEVLDLLGATSQSRDPDVEALVARIVVLNPAAPDDIVVTLMKSRFCGELRDVFALRTPLTARLAAAVELATTRGHGPFLLLCDNPPLAAALVMNNSWTGDEDLAASILERQGLWETVDVAALNVAVWTKLSSDRVGPIVRWFASELGTSASRWRLALELLDGFTGTFGELRDTVATTEQ